MADQPTGRYRTVTHHGGHQYAWVVAGEMGGEDVREAEYRARGYQPPFEQLPLKQDYEIAALPEGQSDGSPTS